MAEEKKADKKVKLPTAKKRDLQNEKKRVENKSFRAKVLTAIRSLESSIAQKEEGSIKEKLSAIYSLCDKGVKTGLYKPAKASRIKSRLRRATA